MAVNEGIVELRAIREDMQRILDRENYEPVATWRTIQELAQTIRTLAFHIEQIRLRED